MKSLKNQTIVIKLGTSTLTHGSKKLDRAHMLEIVRVVHKLVEQHAKVILVSSGAMAAGRELLGYPDLPKDVRYKQMLASIGQVKLIEEWAQLFSIYSLNVGQILITRADLESRERYLNARDTLFAQLELGIIPIINENDAVSISEIKVGDNDNLAALSAVLVEADKVILLTDQDGLYTADPRKNKDAKLIRNVDWSMMTDSARILVVDNYDSFVYTIVGYLKTLGATVTVVRNDAIDPSQPGVIDEYDGVLISPGPGAPAESGASEDMIRLCAKLDKPMFGVCLGMQALAEVFGATVSHAPTIMHGKTSQVEHIDDEIFDGVANPMTATRYHSLAVEPESVPDDLVVTAWTQGDHIVQGIKHRSKPMYAVQFHPESVMTQDGYRLLANWLKVCGQESAVEKSIGLQPKVSE